MRGADFCNPRGVTGVSSQASLTSSWGIWRTGESQEIIGWEADMSPGSHSTSCSWAKNFIGYKQCLVQLPSLTWVIYAFILADSTKVAPRTKKIHGILKWHLFKQKVVLVLPVKLEVLRYKARDLKVKLNCKYRQIRCGYMLYLACLISGFTGSYMLDCFSAVPSVT